MEELKMSANNDLSNIRHVSPEKKLAVVSHPQNSLIKKKDKMMWKRVMKFMKQHPDILIDLVAEKKQKKLEQSAYRRFEDFSPY